MKSFSTVRATQRGSQCYMEKRRGRREIEVARRRGRIKRGESKLASNHFPMWSPQSGSSVMFMELHIEEKRKEGDRGGQEDKRGIQKERDPASNQFPKCSPQPGTNKEIHLVW